MGGIVGFTLRLEDGREYRMSEWTNCMPEIVDNMKMVNKDPAHLNQIVSYWENELRKPEDEQSWTVCSPFMAPSEYGLVVVDLKANVILDCNHYHSFGWVDAICMVNSTPVEWRTKKPSSSQIQELLAEDHEYPGSYLDRFFEFHSQKRIQNTRTFTRKQKERTFLNIDVNNWLPKKIMNQLILPKNKYADFQLDMSPLEVTRYERTPEGLKSMRQAILDLGFKLSKEERKMWNDDIRDRTER